MQVQFNRPVTISGVTYGKGQHAVPDEVKGDWFFEALVKDGDVVVLRAEKVHSVPTPAVSAPAVVAEQVQNAAKAPDVLDGTTKQIAAAIQGLEVEQLMELMEREQAGKTRKGVVRLLEEALGAE